MDDLIKRSSKKVIFVRSSGIFDDSRSTKELKIIASKVSQVIVLAWDRYGEAQSKNEELFSDYQNIAFTYYEKRVPTGIGLKNSFKLFGWLFWVKRMISKIKPDLVHFCDLDSCFFAVKMCVREKIHYIYDIFDYYTDSHSVPCLLENIIEKREIYAINNAVSTIICTEERKAQISKARPKKIVVIHNSPSLIELQNDNKRISYDYVYCGSLDEMRLISEILDRYPLHSDLKVLFAGYGPFSKKCEELSLKYSNFIFKKRIPYRDVLKYESESICLSAIYEPTIRNHRLCAPNKFYESLCLGKPVVVCKGTGIDKIVEKYGIGFAIDYNADEFYRAIELIKKSNNEETSSQAIRVFNENYNWDTIMKPRLLRLYEEALNG